MYLSYSGFAAFRSCRRSYFYRYVGKPSLPEPANRVHMLYGDVVGKLFEEFYRKRVWMEVEAESILADLVRPTLRDVMSREIKKGGVFNWKERGLKPGNRSLDEVEEEIRESIPRGIKSIKFHRLVGLEADAEVVLDSHVQGHKIAGRADFIIKRVRPHDDLVIIDGKGTRWFDKYTDARQLKWYAMLYRLKKNALPDRLGFLYWRKDPEESMSWIDVVPKQLDELQNAALEAIEEITAAREALTDLSNPGMIFYPALGSVCRVCDYQPVCPEGSKSLSDNTKKLIQEDLQHGVEDGEISF